MKRYFSPGLAEAMRKFSCSTGVSGVVIAATVYIYSLFCNNTVGTSRLRHSADL